MVTVQAADLAQDLAVWLVERNQRIGWILWLENDLAIDIGQLFNSRFVADQGDNDISRPGIRLLSDEDIITIEDGCTDHAVTFDFENEDIAVIGQEIRRKWEESLDVFLGKDRHACCDFTNQGQRDHSIGFLLRNRDRPALARGINDLALILQTL